MWNFLSTFAPTVVNVSHGAIHMVTMSLSSIDHIKQLGFEMLFSYLKTNT